MKTIGLRRLFSRQSDKKNRSRPLRGLRVESLEMRAMLTTLFVESGATGGDGSANAPFGTIGDAVAAAADAPGDDTIMIAAGVYEENVEIEDDDALTLKGQGDVTIRHPEIVVDPEEEPDPDDVIEAEGDVTFQNLTIEGLNLGGDFGGRGIDAKDGSFTLINIVVSGTDGDALRFRDFDELTIKNSDVSSLNADGIDIEDGVSVLITNTNATNSDDEGLEVDDVESIIVSGGYYTDNGDDGIDIDNSGDIRVINVVSIGNDGNGLQVEAGGEDDDDFDVILSVTVIGGRFDDNGENGIQIVEGIFEDEDTGEETVDGEVQNVRLVGNTSNNNAEAGYDIDISGIVAGKGNKAGGNADNTVP